MYTIYKNDALKIIGMVTMLIDHLGVMFFPEYRIFRTIGRIAFPIFAFYIAMGFQFTHNRTQYVKRLLILGVIAQVPYMFMYPSLEPVLLEFNVVLLFAYAIGMLVLLEYALHKWKEKNYGISLLALFCMILMILLPDVLSQIIDGFYLSYGTYGLIMIVLFYSLSKRPIALFISYLVFTLVFTYLRGVDIMAYYTDYSYFEALVRFKDITKTIIEYDEGLRYLRGYFFQARSILGVITILIFSRFHFDLRLNKYVSYVFYPAHMAIILLITYIL